MGFLERHNTVNQELNELNARYNQFCLAFNSQYRKPRIERVERKAELVVEVERILTEFQGYGYRRATKELHRRNQFVNHKKVLSLMRQEQLLCKQGKRKNPKTTNSNHSNQIYPNLIKKLKPSKPDQVWHSDLTYIRLNHGFVYLAAVLDGFSRALVGSAVGLFLDASLPHITSQSWKLWLET